MKVRPILFSSQMVRALLNGRKTQTRRILKGSTEFKGPYNPAYIEAHKHSKGWAEICPYGKLGDLLWVRETWAKNLGSNGGAVYYADYESASFHRYELPSGKLLDGCDRWKPSIHMPRRISRLTLEITETRMQRLQDISREDALAEGVTGGEGPGYDSARYSYQHLWLGINGPGSWDANPWVWVLTFRVHKQNVDNFIKSREAA